MGHKKKGYYDHGTIKNPEKLKSSGLKRLMEDALWTQGIRKKSKLKRNRYDFQTDHGLRKWFKTGCEISGMKSINIEILMGHSIGISDSYYKITENELLTEYLKVSDYSMVSNEKQLQKQYDKIQLQNQNDIKLVKEKLFEKENETGLILLKRKKDERFKLHLHNDYTNQAIAMILDIKDFAKMFESLEEYFLKAQIESYE